MLRTAFQTLLDVFVVLSSVAMATMMLATAWVWMNGLGFSPPPVYRTHEFRQEYRVRPTDLIPPLNVPTTPPGE